MIEYREYRGEQIGLDASDPDTLHGLVTPFGVETVIGDLKRGGFHESVEPGAFAKTLQERDVVLIHNHDTAMPLARMSVPSGDGSLSLREDPSAGLRAVAKPVPTSYGKDVLLLAKTGVLRGMSFGFEVIKDSWTDDEGRASNAQVGTHRRIQEVRLHEVTTTAFPAYPTTQLSARDTVSAAREGVEAARSSLWCSECGEFVDPIEGRSLAHRCETRKEAPKPYGDVEYADPKNGKYPLDTEEHAKAAWAYISMPKNAAEYPMNGVSLVSVKAAILAALKKFGVTVTEQNSAELATEWRDFMNTHSPDSAADGSGCSCVAAVDASLDEAMNKVKSIDRNTLPPEINQMIDLVSGASHLIGEHNKNAGVPDPDKPNGNHYASPTDGAGSATPDEDAERSDLKLLGDALSFRMEI